MGTNANLAFSTFQFQLHKTFNPALSKYRSVFPHTAPPSFERNNFQATKFKYYFDVSGVEASPMKCVALHKTFLYESANGFTQHANEQQEEHLFAT